MPAVIRPRGHVVNLLGALVTAVQDDLAAALETASRAGGVHSAAVLALDTWPGCSIDFLSRILGITHSGAVRLAGRLGADGLLERRPGPDARTAALWLTPAGHGQAAALREARRAVLESVVDPLDASELAQLGTLLEHTLSAPARTRSEARRCCRLCDHAVCRKSHCPIGRSADAREEA